MEQKSQPGVYKANPHLAEGGLRMDSEKRRPSCRDQFENNEQPETDRWIEGFVMRLRKLLDRIAGK
jgi:hypothetical protein